MATVLVVKAHPLTAEESRSVRMMDIFINNYQKNNPEDVVTVLDLYDRDLPEIDADLLSAWGALRSGEEFSKLSTTQQKKVTAFNNSTEQFLAADKIVIVNALWNLNVPGRLKDWLDSINVAGSTFKYTENGPVGLVEGKKMLHIQSNGGIYGGNEPSSQYIEKIFNFIGVTDTQQLFIEGIDYEPERAEEILQGIEKETIELAKNF